jgi:hypothetical protein
VPPLAAVPDLDAELDALYALPPSEFTAARNALAAKLKRAHQESHADVRALRKPNLVAWLANRLARDQPEAVAALLDAGSRLRAAQAGALAGRGGAPEVGAAAAAEREALRRLVAAARALLEETGQKVAPSVLDRLSQTLRAASIDDEARPLLERGRLTEEVKTVGFGSLAAVTPAPRPRPRRDDARKAARARVQELRAAARTARTEARASAEAAQKAERSAEVLRAEAEERAAAAEQAAAAVAEAEEALRALK